MPRYKPNPTPFPFEYGLSGGNYSGYNFIEKFGRNTDVDTAPEDIWDGGGLYTFLTAAESLTVTSTSASDGAGEGGASRIEIQGLDENYAALTEEVTLSSGGSVQTTASFIRVFRGKVKSAGANDKNFGNIQIYANSTSVIQAQISACNNQTLMAIYTIPASSTGYFQQYYFSILKSNTTGAVDVDLFIRPFGEVFQLNHTLSGQAAGTSFIPFKFKTPLRVTEKSDILLRGEGSTVDFDVSGGFSLVRIDHS